MEDKRMVRINRMKLFGLAFLAVIYLVSLNLKEANAKMVTKTVEYKQDGTVMRGFLAYDDALAGKAPGVLVVPEWWGLNDFARDIAKKLVGLGYVAFAADMYGGGYITTNREEAAKLAAIRENPPLLRARAQAALKTLVADPRVDPQRLAAIGFCFGGTTVLQLAYSGADLSGVVSFHGGLPPASPEDVKRIKAAILVLHGADDSHVPMSDVNAFIEAVRQAKLDWQMVCFSGAVHGYMNPANGDNPASGVAYNAKAARRSWQYMQDFFQEIFAAKGTD
jgi:dienelactone hydrolase